MEESEKRRERLKTMRMEATRVEESDDVKATMCHSHLSNPLIELSVTPPAKNMNSRFDFYTDPMAVFSGGKKRCTDVNQIQYDYPSIPNIASPQNQFSSSYSDSTWPRNPQIIAAAAAAQFRMNYSPDPRPYTPSFSSPGSGSWRTPTGRGSPLPWISPISPKGSTCHVRGVLSWSGQSRGNSPHSGSGKVGSRYSSYKSQSPGSAKSNGWGRGLHNQVSAHEHPDRFYKKSMVEDPWKNVEPVVRLIEDAYNLKVTDSLQSCLPKSVTDKKAQIIDVIEPNSERNLAECLAFSFKEAVSEDANENLEVSFPLKKC